MKIAILLFLNFLFSSLHFQEDNYFIPGISRLNSAPDSISGFAKKLIKSYPDFITGFADNHLIFKDGSKLLWDDGIKNKSFKDLMEKPDPKDIFVQQYVTGALKSLPAKNFDPGRVR